MSNLHSKMDWATGMFKAQVKEKVDRDGNHFETYLEAAKANLGLLYYVKKIYPNSRFPAYERQLLDEVIAQTTYRALAEEAGFKF